MNKITDADYYLPHIFAVSPLDEATSGTTTPVIIRGMDEKTGDESREYYLKPMAAHRMSARASMFELLAAFMAKQLDLNVAEPVLINVSDAFTELCQGKPYYRKVADSIGINFGTINFGGGFYTWFPETSLPFNLEDEALKIFVFDMLIQNADRGHQKANLNTNGKELKIFDHELAFSYTSLIGTTAKKEWELDENGAEKDLIFKHIFHRHLKGNKSLRIDDVADSLKSIDYVFWRKAKKLIPAEWMDESFQKIKLHTESVVSNVKKFKTEIRRVLS
jgi:hypothetical protein